ncbi:MAG: hypothetical protein CHACPFDD_04133 [Phycisphaerae bacterium]|nr:hypothetical protein [Phycisphaerae bacterium]
MPNLRDDELYGGEDGTPVTSDETQAGGKSCDQMEQVQHDVEGATKTPGTIFKVPAKPGRP